MLSRSRILKNSVKIFIFVFAQIIISKAEKCEAAVRGMELMMTDFTFTLSWNSTLNSSGVIYNVKRKLTGMSVWQIVASCRAIRETFCTFEPSDVISERIYGVEGRTSSCPGNRTMAQLSVSPFRAIQLSPPKFSIEIFSHHLFVRPLLNRNQRSSMFQTLNIQYQVRIRHASPSSEISYKLADLASTEIEVETVKIGIELCCIQLRFYNEILQSQGSSIGSGLWSPEQCINISSTSEERFPVRSIAIISMASVGLVVVLCACFGFKMWKVYSEAKKEALPLELVETMNSKTLWEGSDFLLDEEAVPVTPLHFKNNFDRGRCGREMNTSAKPQWGEEFDDEIFTNNSFQHLRLSANQLRTPDRYNDFHTFSSQTADWKKHKGFMRNDLTHKKSCKLFRFPAYSSGDSTHSDYVTEHQVWNVDFPKDNKRFL